MPRVRANGAQRWAQRTAAATPDYQAGVNNPRQSWQQATVAASDAHKAATTKALNEGRFAKGVQKAGDAKWQRAAAGKGAQRFGEGAAAGVNDYSEGVAPFIAVIERTPLPPRGPKGDPRNIDRVRVLADALHKAKTGFVSFALAIALGLGSVAVVAGISLWKSARAERASGGDKTGLLVPAASQTGKTAKAILGLALAAAVIAASSMAAIDTVTFSVTAAAAGGAAMAAVAGDSANVRNSTFAQKPVVAQHWVKSQTSGFYQFTHPSGHDLVRDIRGRHVAAAVIPLFAPGFVEPTEPQETIAAQLGAGAVAGDVELLVLQMYYPDLPGVQAQLIDLAGLDARMVDYVTVEDSTTATAAATYGGARALNAGSDLLKANTDYAILGAHIGGVCGALTIRGVDTGNLRVAIPGMPGRPDLTANWFCWMTQETGIPLIPVINSANKAGIFIENITDENLVAVPFALLLAELSRS